MTIREFIRHCLWPVLFMGLLMYASSSRAASELDGDQGTAYSHAISHAQTYATGRNAVTSFTNPCSTHPSQPGCWTVGTPVFIASVSISGQSVPAYRACAKKNSESAAACTQADGYGAIGIHGYPSIESCSSQDPINVSLQEVTGSELDSGSAGSICVAGCTYQGSTSSGVCLAYGDPKQYWCDVLWSPSVGSTCSDSDSVPSGGAPPGGAYDCTNTQCVVAPGEPPGPGSGSNPSNQSGIGGGPGPDPVPPGSGQTGGSHGTGDGDSTTPIPGGGGGAGQDAGDCNPLSNPDCGYTGAGGASGNCEELPECAGDPVQCAILRQTWATACMDNGEVSVPSDCDAEATCEGDIVNCSSLLLARSQFCALFGDTDYLTGLTPTTDADFGRDLKDEAENISVADAIDLGGFAGGGQCPADIPVAVLGTSINVPFTAMCDLAALIRPLVILSALLGGYMLIGGRR